VSAALFLGVALAFLLPFATVSCDTEDRTTFTGLQLATRSVPETPTEIEGDSLSSLIEDSGARAATFVLLSVAAGLLLVGLGRRGGGWFAFGALGGLAWLGREATGARPFITVHAGYWLALGFSIAAVAWYGVLALDRLEPRPYDRRPWVVLLLTVVTLGAYHLYWYYAINRDLNELGKRLGEPNRLRVRPWLALLALTFGALLLVPPFVSMWRTFTRIRRAGELAGVEDPLEPGIAIALTLGAIVYVVPIALLYEQSHLNELWKQAGAEEGRSDAAAPVPLPA
jgi:Domain of unknown function (DUF4234)